MSYLTAEEFDWPRCLDWPRPVWTSFRLPNPRSFGRGTWSAWFFAWQVFARVVCWFWR